MIVNIFSTPIYATVFDHLDNSAMVDYVLDYSKKHKTVEISNEGGYQSDDLQGVHMPLNELFKEIDYTVNAFAQRIGVVMPTRIDNIWININSPGSYNIEHRHPNSLISGVFYLKVPKNSGPIVFTNPMPSFDMIWSKRVVDVYNAYTSVEHTHNPIDNALVLFPSWLSHRVERNKSNENRISLAFNCSPIKS